MLMHQKGHITFIAGCLVGEQRLINIGNHMVTDTHHLDLTFGALSDATRRSILMRLVNRPCLLIN